MEFKTLKTRRCQILLTVNQEKLLREEAEAKQIGLSELIRRICDDYLENQKSK